jgi:hypothetical protein
MYARWGSFGVGVALMLSPLVLGYGSVALILHDVAMGALACIATLAALEWPRARFALAAPGLWLVAFAPSAPERAATAADLVAGSLLLALSAIPSAPFARRAPVAPQARNARARA